ncbi:putative NADPH-dependent beta-ketoacyl reductase [Gonapodya prolifera JEL478]|uniref:Putative NADPH-dependent beta-ketoacyl reductase n=1 Tax=Gonapodya prolifera (strain JEL478) TaxID=1344416 RepID=A0A139AV92_GONPJ|nr:putative NADPH-dependent beta-ketoacyl reductase [Gonapodya prolifera JEL478]|eukprot:KXS20627.1 putative NADPH-dependent beta-ketoacyl reductase [Gonapodya prolifera JEL478]
MAAQAPTLKAADLFDVKGKVALVTGGGTGIGKMWAETLAHNGVTVYIASRKVKPLQEAADEINALARFGGKCIPIQADVADKKGCDALVDAIKARGVTKLHILVNNAGISWGDPMTSFPEKEGWDRLMALNVKSAFYLTTASLPLLLSATTPSDPARVINISSMASVLASVSGPLSAPGSGTWSYQPSKAAVNHLTRSLALELGPKGVTANVVCPGVFRSRMTAFGVKNSLGMMEASQPLGRIGVTEDMAGLCLFLCSRASAYLNGAAIPIDGGAGLGGRGKGPVAKV